MLMLLPAIWAQRTEVVAAAGVHRVIGLTALSLKNVSYEFAPVVGFRSRGDT
jgi:hypothetical protein